MHSSWRAGFHTAVKYTTTFLQNPKNCKDIENHKRRYVPLRFHNQFDVFSFMFTWYFVSYEKEKGNFFATQALDLFLMRDLTLESRVAGGMLIYTYCAHSPTQTSIILTLTLNHARCYAFVTCAAVIDKLIHYWNLFKALFCSVSTYSGGSLFLFRASFLLLWSTAATGRVPGRTTTLLKQTVFVSLRYMCFYSIHFVALHAISSFWSVIQHFSESECWH